VASHGRNDTVYRAAAGARAEALDLLQQVVDIDSGTGDIAGGSRVEAILAPRLQSIGAQVRTVPAEVGTVAPNLVAVLHGSGKTRVLIVAHIDTVFGPGTVAHRPFRIDSRKAYGPGVVDEKGGVVTAVTALEILRRLKFQDYASVTLLIEAGEEIGSPGAGNLIKSLAKQSDVAFNMEPGDLPDTVTVWRKGADHLFIQVRGRAAHAGMAPEDGRNAAAELVHQLGALQGAFPQSGADITVNLTTLKSGERTNIVPDFAEAALDVRFRTPAQFDAVLARIKSGLLPPLALDTSIEVQTRGIAYPPLVENGQVEALGRLVQRIYAELGKSVSLSGNGGASESALVASLGTPVLDGLGFVGSGLHTDHEWLDLASVTPRLYLFTRLLMEASRGPSPNPPRHVDVPSR
jgi:glutamate carboxypeptidase